MAATLKSRFPDVIASLRPRVGAAVKEAAEVVKERAQDRVPVDEGDLHDAIHTERREAAEYAVVAGDGDEVFYGHMVENGTVRTPARPFLVPATEASSEDAEALVTAALRGL